VGWSISEDLGSERVIEALNMALGHEGLGA
jgi:hypothetical protein